MNVAIAIGVFVAFFVLFILWNSSEVRNSKVEELLKISNEGRCFLDQHLGPVNGTLPYRCSLARNMKTGGRILILVACGHPGKAIVGVKKRQVERLQRELCLEVEVEFGLIFSDKERKITLILDRSGCYQNILPGIVAAHFPGWKIEPSPEVAC